MTTKKNWYKPCSVGMDLLKRMADKKQSKKIRQVLKEQWEAHRRNCDKCRL
jgi:hypothetical protein